MSLMLVPCPLCGQSETFLDVSVPDTDVHIGKYGQMYGGRTISEWKICGRCGFVHQNPRPSTAALNEFYTQSNYHAEPENIVAAEHLAFARWYFSEKIDFALDKSGLSKGRVFDIGCGRGGVLKLFEERGWQSCGVEPDQNQARFAIEEFGLTGVKQGILDSHIVLEEKVDLVFSNHAFEHFADLDEVMQGVKNIIKPGGYLFIAIPTYFANKTSLSKQWMNSAHYSLFTHNSLSNLLSKYGFEEICHTYNGWSKEKDDLWYFAKFTDKVATPREYFEAPEEVSHYLRVINPLRSILFYPIYSHLAWRVRIYNMVTNAFKLFISSPSAFFRKLFARIRRAVKMNQSTGS